MVRNTAFKNLDQIKVTHTKVQNNQYLNMDKPQDYLTSKLFSNQQCFLIFATKSHTLRGVKANFKNMYSDNTLCPLCERSIDTQDHIAHCLVLKNCVREDISIDYTHLTGTLEQQASFIASYEKLLEARDELLSEAEPAYQGFILGPCTPWLGPTGLQLRRARDRLLYILLLGLNKKNKIKNKNKSRSRPASF